MEPVTATSPSILIVEDDVVVAADLAQNLRRFGYKIAGTAYRASEAIRIAEGSHPQLAVLDICLPGEMDGIDAAAELRRRWNIPIVFVTGNNDEALLARAKAVNPSAYLTKPLRSDELNATVAVALHQHNWTQQLFEKQAWLSSLLGNIREGVIATDADGRVRYMNKMAETLTRSNELEAYGRPVEEVYRPFAAESADVDFSPIRHALGSNTELERVQLILDPSAGRRLFIENTTVPIRDAEGGLAGTVTVFQDVTARVTAAQERERLVAELERSNTELGRFAYSVSHDLQEPARTIRSLSELLIRPRAGMPDDEEKHLLEMISAAADHMQKLIASLLEYAQVGEGDLHREQVDVREVIETIRRNLSSALSDSGAAITCGSLPRAYADPLQLERVLQNLIMNAIVYGQRGSKPLISIDGEPVEDGCQLRVSDNGIGITCDSLEKIFQPLIRLHAKDVPGTGLGLATCRIIVGRHGGRIWAESNGENCGTTFRIFLPKRAGESR